MEKYKNIEYLVPYIVVVILFVIGLILVFTSIHLRALKRLYDAQIGKSKLEIQHQKEILNMMVKVQEDERKRIGRAIHDDISNRIHLLSMCVQNIEMVGGKSKDILLTQLPLLSDAARNIAHEMYPVEIEYLGLKGMLENMQIYLCEQINLQVRIEESFKIDDLQAEVQLYRIIQEFVNNAIKYALATELFLIIRQTDHYLGLLLRDNGIGFNLDEIKKGMGMKNIEYRVGVLFGAYKWKSTTLKGTTLLIKIANSHGK